MLYSNLNKNINFEDSYNIFCNIADGKLQDDEIKEILLKINQIGISENLILAAIKSFSQRSRKINISGDIFDVCGTGGDGLNTLNISTAVSFVAACANIKIAKHGNKAVSSKSGSADIFSKANITMLDDPIKITDYLNKFNLAFIFAPFFHPSFKNVAKARAELKIKTIFNYLGPLLNPANPNYQLIGCSDYKISEIMAKSCQKLNKKRVIIAHSFDGLDEISVSDKSYIFDVKDGEVNKNIISPLDFDIKISKIEDIKGGYVDYNYNRMIELFSGIKDSYYDIVVINTAHILLLNGKFGNIFKSISKAKEILDQKLPLKLLYNIKNGSQN
jgi:anthranilate phosphoribosyltransferase